MNGDYRCRFYLVADIETRKMMFYGTKFNRSLRDDNLISIH